MDLKYLVGQRLVCGFEGTEMSQDFIRLVKEYGLGNVILFQRNIESMTQVKKLCADIQRLVKKETGHYAFIAIDQEGGTVTRLSKDACNVPGAMAVAATGNPKNAEVLAEITANELKYLGINFNLAPVMDVNNNPNNPIIGVRSYGDTAETVMKYGVAALQGYQKEKVLCCAKHFPGHGDTAVDSHLGLPIIDKTLEELEKMELVPFRAVIENGIPAVMSSHILFPKLEPDNVPCTMSKRIITGILKQRIGFQGLVLSDCVEMDAIRKYYGTSKGIVAAMSAGVDMVFVSHTAEVQEKGFQAVYKAIEDKELSLEEMQRVADKIISFKEKYISFDQVDVGCSEEQRQKEREIRRKSIAMTQGKIFPLGNRPFFTGCVNYRATQAANEEEMQETFVEYMIKMFEGRGFATSKNPDQEEIKKVIEMAGESTSVIIGTNNGHLQSGQKALIKALSGADIPVMVIAMGNPYDLEGLSKNVTGIAAWDNSLMTLELLVEMLQGKWVPEGKLPIHLN